MADCQDYFENLFCWLNWILRFIILRFDKIRQWMYFFGLNFGLVKLTNYVVILIYHNIIDRPKFIISLWNLNHIFENHGLVMNLNAKVWTDNKKCHSWFELRLLLWIMQFWTKLKMFYLEILWIPNQILFL